MGYYVGLCEWFVTVESAAPSVALLRGWLWLGFRTCPAPGDGVSLDIRNLLVFVQEVRQVHMSFSGEFGI